MTTQQIADRLVELCKKGQYETAQKELYADDVISIEPYSTPDFEKETKGLNAILEKGHKFSAMVDTMHGGSLSAPLVAGNSIAFALTMDVTMKGSTRQKMTELCVYVIKNGKIVSEQFYM